jgi:hypothetical protein
MRKTRPPSASQPVIRERSLLTGNGIPDKELASDHLPILLDLDFLEESESEAAHN